MPLEPSLTFKTQGVYWIAYSLYVETPQALASVLQEVEQIGYTIKNLREDEHRKKCGTSVQQMEEQGYSLWFVHLENIRHGKCGTCHAYISTRGIRKHGHTCEKCGAITYLDIQDGSIIRFRFVGDEHWMQSLEMKVLFWDTEQSDLYLYKEPVENGYFTALQGENARKYLEEYKHCWEAATHKGIPCIKVKYAESPGVDPIDAIEVSEKSGHYWNHDIVRLWQGKEYSEHGEFPVPDMFSIYETWHWAPYPRSPKLHEHIIHAAGQISRVDYYYQDGRVAFTRGIWDRMRLFVDKFTEIDVREWDRAQRSFPSDGPGAIRAIARFCHPSPQIENNPNIGNTIVALGKRAQNKRLTPEEIEAAIDGLEDMTYWNE